MINTSPLEIFKVPRYVVFGPNALSKVKEVISYLGKPQKPILILTGKVHSKQYAEKLEIENSNIETIEYGDITEVENLLSKYSKDSVSYVLGVGGGKVIDIAKTVAYILGKPFISIPTVASHDGISSPYISYILQLDLAKKLNIRKVYKVPIAIIADTSVIVNAPDRYFRAGIGEVFGKIIAVKDWELAHRVKGESFSEFAATLSLSAVGIINRNLDKLRTKTESSIRVLVKALIGCGVAMAIAGSSRPCSGSEHMFSHAIDLLSREYGFKPALHGEQVALGTLMMSYLHGLKWKLLKKKFKKVMVPTSAKEIGLDRSIIIDALLIAHKIRPDRYTILGTDGLTRKAAEQIVDTIGLA